jgi:hypothetical protein
MSAILAGRQLPPPPISVDYTKGLPDDLGAMLNDQLSCCTASAYFHARQVWQNAAQGKVITDFDSDVRALYEGSTGYDPANPLTDEGGVEQEVLTYLMNTGAPIGDGTYRDKLLGFCEVDPRNLQDVKRAVFDCGVAYIGFDIPNALFANGDPPPVWQFDTSNSGSAGGHAVVIAGYDLEGFTVISWGKRYKMTWFFFTNYISEVYALADATWVSSTGKTPAGMTLELMEAQMAGLKQAA